MRTLLCLLLCLPLLARAAPPAVTITAARLLDVQTGRYLAQPLVRIEGGHVTEVRARRPGEPTTYDLGDAVLLPGLIDCHVHLIGSEIRSPYERLRETTARAAIEGVHNAGRLLRAGFTRVRDLGGRESADVALRDAIADGRVPGPRLFVATLPISSTGGHGDRNDLPPDIEVRRLRAIADGPEEVRRRVRENVRQGAD